MSATDETLAPGPASSARGPRSARERTTAVRAWVRGAWDVVVLEAKQRLRSRGWYIMLAIWFVLIAIVTFLTWSAWAAQHQFSSQYASSQDLAPAPGPGSMIFEVVLAFVLFLALVVSPALSANAVNGDRAQGTLAILQASLLRPGQILAGKLVAAWLAALAFLVAASPFLIIGVVVGGLSPGYVVVSLLMLALELGIVSAIGTALSSLAGRPLFSIVVTYLLVAMLCVGTVIAFGFGSMLARGTVEANMEQAKNVATYSPALEALEYTCVGSLMERPVNRTERVAWLLALNPYVVVADAIPYPDRSGTLSPYSQGVVETVSQGARSALAGPDATYPCANGQPRPLYLNQKTPLWPLGLGLQLVLAGSLLWGARRALVTPARGLPRGTRVA